MKRRFERPAASGYRDDVRDRDARTGAASRYLCNCADERALLTVIVQQSGIVKLVRTVELTEMTHEEILAVLFPTLAFVEDHYQSKPARLLFCGMDDLDGWGDGSRCSG